MHQMGFNPLTGIRSFLTQARQRGNTLPCNLRFNPLTGIRSFLTNNVWMFGDELTPEFQSPHGDSFFSDAAILALIVWLVRNEFRFNPLTGIRSFLTQRNSRQPQRNSRVSIPSRGFVLF